MYSSNRLFTGPEKIPYQIGSNITHSRLFISPDEESQEDTTSVEEDGGGGKGWGENSIMTIIKYFTRYV